MSLHLDPTLAALKSKLSGQKLDVVISTCAEGYLFPANLDIDSSLSGMAPEGQQGLMRRALKEGWDAEKFRTALAEQQGRKRSF